MGTTFYYYSAIVTENLGISDEVVTQIVFDAINILCTGTTRSYAASWVPLILAPASWRDGQRMRWS